MEVGCLGDTVEESSTEHRGCSGRHSAVIDIYYSLRANEMVTESIDYVTTKLCSIFTRSNLFCSVEFCPT